MCFALYEFNLVANYFGLLMFVLYVANMVKYAVNAKTFTVGRGNNPKNVQSGQNSGRAAQNYYFHPKTPSITINTFRRIKNQSINQARMKEKARNAPWNEFVRKKPGAHSRSIRQRAVSYFLISYKIIERKVVRRGCVVKGMRV